MLFIAKPEENPVRAHGHPSCSGTGFAHRDDALPTPNAQLASRERELTYKVAVSAAGCHNKVRKTFDLLVIPGADHTSGGEYGDRKRWDFFVHYLLGVEPPDHNAPSYRRG